jgi:hypothetical protein
LFNGRPFGLRRSQISVLVRYNVPSCPSLNHYFIHLMDHSKPLLFILPLILVACSSAPLAPIDRTHPASADAPNALGLPLAPSLNSDAITQHTHQLLAQREAQTRAAQDEKPADQTNLAPASAGDPNHAR